MNKLIITRWNQCILTVLLSGNEAVEIGIEPDNQTERVNNIYVGKVKRIVKNINSAFVEYQNDKVGYYSLIENTGHLYTQPGIHDRLKEGDEIVVQLAKEAVKTKDPVLSSVLTFTGKYAVLTYGKPSIGFSQKLPVDDEWKQELKCRVQTVKDEQTGIIIRTNAGNAEIGQILSEIEQLQDECRTVLSGASYRTAFSRLYQAPAGYLKQIKEYNTEQLETVVTDQKDIYEECLSSFNQVTFYQDEQVSLFNLYRLQRILDEALEKRVWLKSGGYLVIEPTEALTVIDVNTGKYSGKKNLRETILKINLEAAEAVARQLRLRNLTGIIIVDFIDMKHEEDRAALMQALKRYTGLDMIKTTVVDMTALNLVELTRKKGRRPLSEQLKYVQERR